MDVGLRIFEVIDMRSFSNLWFWIALAVFWSSASHWILGVPFDMVSRAKRHEGAAQQALEDLVRINVDRILYIADVSGLSLLTLSSFLIAGLLTLGFFYGLEFAQAVVLLAIPLALLTLMNIRTARIITRGALAGDALRARLARHRVGVQGLGVISIFVTALWGMYQNLSYGLI
ncbi:component of SufBCD complex [Pseudaestuariivita sp.]|uniref:component of SufBCD complex n=1 Tax=Pseudaestuariivita sp. TaxID=2211669 RepID=UPI00405875BC